jgi:hypothetical protein
MKDQPPGDFDGVNNKDVSTFMPVKTVSFLWGLLRCDWFVERSGMQAPVKGMIFLTGLATDEVPDGNGMGFVKNRSGVKIITGERF